jgi:L-fuculose-phosphate aldolase
MWPVLGHALNRLTNQQQYRSRIVHYGKMLHGRGYVAATDGNLSVRFDDDRILITPTCTSKAELRSADIVTVNLEGELVNGRKAVSSEVGMHVLIYKNRPDVRAIVHAHPPTATGFAAAGVPLNQPLVCEVVIGLGSIPLARYGTPGTHELADSLEPLVADYDAILMSNHGVVTYGENLENAYMKMETVEHFAQIALVTHLLGRQQPLGESEVQKLSVVRTNYRKALTNAALIANERPGNHNGNHFGTKRGTASRAGSGSAKAVLKDA